MVDIQCPFCRAQIEPSEAGTCPTCQAILTDSPDLTSGAVTPNAPQLESGRGDQWLAGCTFALVLGGLGTMLTVSLVLWLLPKDACGTATGAFVMLGFFLGLPCFTLLGASWGWRWGQTQGGSGRPSCLSPRLLRQSRVVLAVFLIALFFALGIWAPRSLLFLSPFWLLGAVALIRGDHIGTTLALLIVAILTTLGVLLLLACV